MRSSYILKKILGSVRNAALFFFLIALFPAIAAIAIYLVEGKQTGVATLTTAPTLPESDDDISTIGSDQSQKLTVNAQLQVAGELRLVPSSVPATASAGTLVFDEATSTLQYFNGSEFVSLTAQNAQTGQVINIFNTGVSSLMGQTGDLVFQGTQNRVSVSVSNGVVSLSTPQDLNTTANVQFGSVRLQQAGVVYSNRLAQTASGSNIIIDAGADGVLFTDGSRTFRFPSGGDVIQEICTDAGNCGSGGSGGVTSLNSMSGALTIQGTANQINVLSASDIVTLSTPQDIAVTSSPTFNNLTLSGDLAVNGGDITTTSLTANVFNTAGATVSVGSGAAAINLGASADTSITIGSNTGTGTLGLNSGGNMSVNVGGLTQVLSAGGINMRATSSTNLNIDGDGSTNLGTLSTNVVNIGLINRNINLRGSSTFISNGSLLTVLIRGASGQSANLQEWQTNGGTVLGSMGPTGNFSIDQGTFFVDASANRVGIGNTAPSATLEVTGDIYLTKESARTIKLANSTTAVST